MKKIPIESDDEIKSFAIALMRCFDKSFQDFFMWELANNYFYSGFLRPFSFKSRILNFFNQYFPHIYANLASRLIMRKICHKSISFFSYNRYGVAMNRDVFKLSERIICDTEQYQSNAKLLTNRLLSMGKRKFKNGTKQ